MAFSAFPVLNMQKRQMHLVAPLPCFSIIMSFCSQFIDGRLEMLDQGKEPDDVFEEEVLQCGAFTVITELHLLVWLLILTALCS